MSCVVKDIIWVTGKSQSLATRTVKGLEHNILGWSQARYGRLKPRSFTIHHH